MTEQWMMAVVMKEMVNWRVCDEMRVIRTGNRQVLQEVHSRDKMKHKGESGCFTFKEEDEGGRYAGILLMCIVQYILVNSR